MFNRLFWFGVKLLSRIYYRKIIVRGEEFVKNEPVIYVSNHNNGAMDAIMIAANCGRLCNFTGAADGPFFKWYLRLSAYFLRISPLYRPEKGGRVTDNSETFKAVTKVLAGKGCVVFFPPGLNDGERAVNRFKSGFARAALGAELSHDFKLGVKIQPIGINYGQLPSFRSTVTLVVGKAIEIRPSLWKRGAEMDLYGSARILTNNIYTEVKRVTAGIEDERYRELVENLGILFEDKLPDDAERFKLIIDKVNEFAPRRRKDVFRLSTKLEKHISEMKKLGIENCDSLDCRDRKIGLFLASPLILLGILCTWPPYKLTGWIVKYFCDDKYYLQTMKFIAGFFVFLAWYFLLGLCLWFLTANPYICLAIMALVLPFSLFANLWGGRFYVLMIKIFTRGRRQRLRALRKQRRELQTELMNIAQMK